ncbi:MAG: hypothetical protein ACREB5_03075 [Sphingomonadaceae bacterium]
MPNASPADVRAGWELFRVNPDITLDDLNRRLAERNHGAVSNRTLQHYRSLLKAGFDRYVSINRFDVARAAKPYEGLSAIPRYFYYGSDVPVTILYQRKKDVEVHGRATRIGEVGALLTITDTTDVEVVRKTRPSIDSFVALEFTPSVGERAVARVVETEINSDAFIEVEFSRLHVVSKLLSAQPLLADRVYITVIGVSADDRAADLIGRRIFYTLEAVEECRSLANEVLRTEASPEAPRMIDPPQLQRLRLDNPLLFGLEIPAGLAVILFTGWCLIKGGGKVADIYKTLSGAKVDQATSTKITAEAKKIEAEIASIELDNIDKAQELATKLLFSLARSEISTQVPLDATPNLSEADQARRATLSGEVLKSIESLRRQDVADVEIAVNPDEAA